MTMILPGHHEPRRYTCRSGVSGTVILAGMRLRSWSCWASGAGATVQIVSYAPAGGDAYDVLPVTAVPEGGSLQGYCPSDEERTYHLIFAGTAQYLVEYLGTEAAP